mgnify:CR=1 FL=1
MTESVPFFCENIYLNLKDWCIKNIQMIQL